MLPCGRQAGSGAAAVCRQRRGAAEPNVCRQRRRRADRCRRWAGAQVAQPRPRVSSCGRDPTPPAAGRRRLTVSVSADAGAPSRTLVIGAVAAMAVIGLAALSAVLSVLAAHGTCSEASVETAPGGAATREIPASYLSLYRHAGGVAGVPWRVLAAIGSIESDHGRSRAPGVHTGVNGHGCCAGPMQFNLRDGPPSTWQRYRVDGNHDGATDVYDPEDAIPSAGNYLRALLARADGNLRAAILAYNHSPAYVADVLARARAYGRGTDVARAGVAVTRW